MRILEKKVYTFGIKLSIVENEIEIGRCYIYIIKNDLHKEPYALLEDVYINENFRGRGIGSEMIKRAIELAKNLGCYKIIATSRFERNNVHKWYEKLGFKKWGYEFRMDLK